MPDYALWNFILNAFQALCLTVAVVQLWLGLRLLLEIYSDVVRRKAGPGE